MNLKLQALTYAKGRIEAGLDFYICVALSKLRYRETSSLELSDACYDLKRHVQEEIGHEFSLGDWLDKQCPRTDGETWQVTGNYERQQYPHIANIMELARLAWLDKLIMEHAND